MPQMSQMPIMSGSEGGTNNRTDDIEFLASLLGCLATWLKGKQGDGSQTVLGGFGNEGNDPLAQWIASLGKT